MPPSSAVPVPLQRLIDAENSRRHNDESFKSMHSGGDRGAGSSSFASDTFEIFKLSLNGRDDSPTKPDASDAAAATTVDPAPASRVTVPVPVSATSEPLPLPSLRSERSVFEQLAASMDEPALKYYPKVRPQEFMGGLLGAPRW